jgi:hypothetical protein
MVCWVFGWSGGKQLVESSYEDAKVPKPQTESET